MAALVAAHRCKLLFQSRDTLTLDAEVQLRDLRRIEQRANEILADLRRELARERMSELGLLVDRQPITEPEFRIVFEQRVRPCRPAAVGIFCPRRGRQIAAVDRGASGRIGDLQPVAEELRQHFEVRCLAATRAGAAEFKQRLKELGAAHIGEVHAGAVGPRQLLEEFDALAAALEVLQPGLHVDRPNTEILGAVGGAILDAYATAGAVLDIDLQRVAGFGIAAGIDGGGFEIRRRVGQTVLVVILGADDAVRADHRALSALDAEVRIPDRHLLGDIALFVLRCRGRVGAVDRQCAHRQIVSVQRQHGRYYIADEFRRSIGHQLVPASRLRWQRWES